MKQEEINQLSIESLKDQLIVSKDKLQKMVLGHKVAPLENPMQIRALRRDIARLNTELKKRNNQVVSDK